METATSIVTALAAAVGAAVAVAGLFTWRKQLRGKTEWELARRLLRKVYELRGAIDMVRNPMMFGGEIAAAFEDAGEPAPEPEKMVEDERRDRVVFQKRWSALRDVYSDLMVEALEAEVLWGQEARDALAPLKECVAELFSAIQMHLYYQQDRSSWQGTPDPERVHEVRMKVYATGGERDELGRQVTEAVDRMEDFLRPHLEL